MFWRFGGYASLTTIDSILDKPDVNLDEVLDESDLIQELKNNNAKLLEYLRNESVLQQLFEYVVAPPPPQSAEAEAADEDAEDDDDEPAPPSPPTFKKAFSPVRSLSLGRNKDAATRRQEEREAREKADRTRQKQAYMACEILASETWSLIEAILHEMNALRHFWDYLRQEPPLDPVTAGYFTKINETLIDKKTEATLDFFKNLDDILPTMLRHVDCPMIMDLLLKIISMERSEGGQGIVDWLQSQDLIPKLLAFLDPSCPISTQTSAGDFIKAIITISANASQNEQSCIGPNSLTRQLVSAPCIEHLIRNMLHGGNPLTVGVGIVIEVIRKNNSDYDPDTAAGHEMMPPTTSDPIYLGTLLRHFANNVPNFMSLILSPTHTVSTGDASVKVTRKALDVASGKSIEPLGFDRFKTCELMAELLHCSNMGLLNERGGEDYVRQRDLERERLRAQGALAPVREPASAVTEFEEDGAVNPGGPADMDVDATPREVGRRLGVMNSADDDGFEDVGSAEDLNDEVKDDFDERPGADLESELESDLVPTARPIQPSKSRISLDDEFFDEPLHSPGLPTTIDDPEDIPESMNLNVQHPAPLSPTKLHAPRHSQEQLPLPSKPSAVDLAAASAEKSISALAPAPISTRPENALRESASASAESSSSDAETSTAAADLVAEIDSHLPTQDASDLSPIQDTKAPSGDALPPQSKFGAPPPLFSPNEVSAGDNSSNTTSQTMPSPHQATNDPNALQLSRTEISDTAHDSTSQTQSSSAPGPQSQPSPYSGQTHGIHPSQHGGDGAVYPAESDMGEIFIASSETAGEQDLAVDPNFDPSHPFEPLIENDLDGQPIVGDHLKLKFVEHRVVPTILDFFFRFPWNNFLHNVVYDVVQQVFNGPMDRGYNRNLAIDLCLSGDITGRVINGQAQSDEEQARSNMRLGYMGHLTLIAEEVVKFSERHPAAVLSAPVVDRVTQPAWVDYVERTLAETRERDNAILGGVRPEVGGPGGAGSAMMGGLGGGPGGNQAFSNTASNALANAGLNGSAGGPRSDAGVGLSSLSNDGIGSSGFVATSNSLGGGSLLSGFGSSSDEEDEEIDENAEGDDGRTGGAQSDLNFDSTYAFDSSTAAGGADIGDASNDPSRPRPIPPPLKITPSRARRQLAARLAMHNRNETSSPNEGEGYAGAGRTGGEASAVPDQQTNPGVAASTNSFEARALASADSSSRETSAKTDSDPFAAAAGNDPLDIADEDEGDPWRSLDNADVGQPGSRKRQSGSGAKAFGSSSFTLAPPPGDKAMASLTSGGQHDDGEEWSDFEEASTDVNILSLSPESTVTGIVAASGVPTNVSPVNLPSRPAPTSDSSASTQDIQDEQRADLTARPAPLSTSGQGSKHVRRGSRDHPASPGGMSGSYRHKNLPGHMSELFQSTWDSEGEDNGEGETRATSDDQTDSQEMTSTSQAAASDLSSAASAPSSSAPKRPGPPRRESTREPAPKSAPTRPGPPRRESTREASSSM